MRSPLLPPPLTSTADPVPSVGGCLTVVGCILIGLFIGAVGTIAITWLA